MEIAARTEQFLVKCVDESDQSPFAPVTLYRGREYFAVNALDAPRGGYVLAGMDGIVWRMDRFSRIMHS